LALLFTISSFIFILLKLTKVRQRKWKKSLLANILLTIALIHLIALGTFFAGIEIYAAAIVTWGILIFILFASGAYYIYYKNNKSLTRKMVFTGLWIGVGIIISILIVSLCMDSFNDFLGFSLSYLAALFCFTVYAIQQLYKDFNQKTTVIYFVKFINIIKASNILFSLAFPNLQI